MLKYSVIYFNHAVLSRVRYYRYDQLHRKDGPAIIWIDKDMQYFLYGDLVEEDYDI
jgi:hypothetical protein